MSIILLLLGCMDKGNTNPEAQVCAAAQLPEGTLFVDQSNRWGLEDISADGIRISVADIDDDGWPDILIRKGDGSDDISSGERYNWVLRNTGTGQFEDITESSGLLATEDGRDIGRFGQVFAVGDVNNDGAIDIFTGAPLDGTVDSEVMLGVESGFEFGPLESDVHSSAARGAGGAAFTDFNRDGALDLWIARANTEQDRLLWGTADGAFTDVTGTMGLSTVGWSNVDSINQALGHSVAWSGAACDLNNDGYPELLAASYGRAPNHLWLNNGGESFENISVASGYAFDARTDWSDNESARCWCMLHPDDSDCAGVPPPELISCNSDDDAFRWNHSYDREAFRLGGNSGTTVCADIDNDGWLDLLTTEIVHWDVGTSSDPSEILWNTQSEIPNFERLGNEEIGLSREHDIVDWNDGDITAAVFDYNNDGLPDILIGSTDYPGTRALLYEQVAPRVFDAVPIESGLDHTRSHGVAVADFDRDGDLDLVLGHSSGRCDEDCYDSFHVRLYENQLVDSGSWVQLQLVGGENSNRSAIGARVEITADGITQTQIVGGGHGHYGMQNDLWLHFGLGEACFADVSIVWPNGEQTTQQFEIQSGVRARVVQGAPPALLSLGQ